MSRLVHLLDDCLPPLFVLTTVLLAIGCGLMCLMRSPAHRQRTGELTLAAVFGWLFLACLPLPRLLPEHLWTPAYFQFRAAAPVHEAASDHGSPAPPTGELKPDSFALLAEDEPKLDASFGDARAGRPRGEVSVSPDTVPGGVDPSSAPLPAGTAISRITAVYLVGAAGCLLWLACGRLRLARIRRGARRPPAWLAQMFEALAQEASERPVLLISRHSARPMSWGIWRPTIVLPLAMARRRHREQLRMVLLHELAHVVRRDGRGNGLVCLALPLLYPHPLFLWLRGQVRMAAELLADDWAAQRGGKFDYVEQLVSLARSSAKSPGLLPLAGAVTLYSSPSQFYRRMQMLISRTCPLSVVPTSRWRFASFAVAALAAVTAASMAGVRPAWSQQLSSGEQAASRREDPTKAQPSPLSAESPEARAAKIAYERDIYAAKIAVGEYEQATLRRDLRQAEADIVGAKQKLATAENQLQYSRKMQGKGYVTQADVESKELALEKAKLEMEAAELSKEVLARALEKLPIVGRLYAVADAETTEAQPNAQEQALRARLSAAEERIRLLEAQLQKAGIQVVGTTPASGKPAPQQPNQITLTRVGQDGSISHETWTTDEEGRPEKLVSKTVGRPGESPIAAAKTTVSPEGRIVKEFKDKEGRITAHIYDRDTGRLIETKRGTFATDSAAAKETDAAGLPAAGKSTAAPESSFGKPRGSMGFDQAAGTETGALDLVKLATAYADAVSALEEAEANLAAGGPDSGPAKAALRSAKRKQELLRSLASVAADAARAELQRTQQLARVGAVTAESATAAESRWKMLNAILQSGSTENPDPDQAGPKSP